MWSSTIFIVVPLTLFLIEMVQERWKSFLRWVLVFQIAFATTRFSSKLFQTAGHPVDIIYHILIVAYAALLIAYPFSFSGGHKSPPA